MWSSRRWARAASAAAVAGAAIAAFAPLGRSCSASSSGPGGCTSTSLFQTEGAWILVVVSIPVLLTVVAAAWDRPSVRIVAAVALWLGCLVAIFSVGIFFLPAAVLLTIAVARRPARTA